MSSSMGRMTIYDHLNHLINLWKVTNMVWNQQPENIWKYEPCGILWAQLIHWEMHRWFSIGWEMPMSWQQTHAACESLPGRLVQRIGKPHRWSQKKACLWENMYFLAADILWYTLVITTYLGNLLIIYRKRDQFSGDDIPYGEVVARWLCFAFSGGNCTQFEKSCLGQNVATKQKWRVGQTLKKCRDLHVLQSDPYFHGNSRILKWRYCTI